MFGERFGVELCVFVRQRDVLIGEPGADAAGMGSRTAALSRG
jgi:hypothetical protein